MRHLNWIMNDPIEYTWTAYCTVTHIIALDIFLNPLRVFSNKTLKAAGFYPRFSSPIPMGPTYTYFFKQRWSWVLTEKKKAIKRADRAFTPIFRKIVFFKRNWFGIVYIQEPMLNMAGTQDLRRKVLGGPEPLWDLIEQNQRVDQELAIINSQDD